MNLTVVGVGHSMSNGALKNNSIWYIQIFMKVDLLGLHINNN